MVNMQETRKDSEEEKIDTSLVESSSSSEDNDESNKLAERRLLRKLDMRLLPMVILIYIMNYIDVSRGGVIKSYL